MSVVRRKMRRKSRVWHIREGEGALVPLRGNDKGRLEFGVGEGTAKRSEVFKRG